MTEKKLYWSVATPPLIRLITGQERAWLCEDHALTVTNSTLVSFGREPAESMGEAALVYEVELALKGIDPEEPIFTTSEEGSCQDCELGIPC